MTSIGIRFVLGGLELLFEIYGVVAVTHFLLQSLFAHLAWRRSLRQLTSEPEQSPYRPSVDVIVACYNEDPERLDACCRSLLDQDYQGAIGVYLVDDGSGNRESLVPVYQRYSGRPGWQVLLPDGNGGKRHAQDLAVRFSNGDLLVTIDSDTQIAPDSIRTIVASFRDERVGAVTGNVGVSNAKVNLLTRLIDLRYWVAFNQERAAQGFFGSVLCCSGPFAVYRRSALTDLWAQYISQTFRGIRCTYGDDRHLTNLVLQRGYHTLYEPRALATTNVPTTMREYLHQQLRWNKSFYRELLWTFGFVYRRPAYLIFEVITQTMLPVLLVLAVASALYSSLLVHPSFLLRYLAMIVVMGLMHCLYGAYRTRRPAFALFVLYGFLHAALLIPVRMRALSSLTDNRWGTRTIPPGGPGRRAGRSRLSARGRQPPAGPRAAAPGPQSPVEG